MLSHGFIAVQETYEKFWGVPENFIAVSGVDGCETLKSGEKVQIKIEGSNVKISRI